jgi:transposase
MGAPCSLDLRKRVVARVEAGDSCRSVAARFGVAVSSVVKWAQRKRETSSVAAKRMGGHRPFVLAGQRAWLLARLTEKPDITLRAVVAELVDRGVVVSYYAVWNFFRHEGKSFKKKPARKRTGQAGRRKAAGAVEKVSRQT